MTVSTTSYAPRSSRGPPEATPEAHSLHAGPFGRLTIQSPLTNWINCSSSSKGFISPKTSADGVRQNGLIVSREADTRRDSSMVRILWALFNTCDLFEDILEVSESNQNCKAMCKNQTDGPITSITLGQHSIADLFPMLVSSVEQLVEFEDGRRASSRQWTLCTSPAKFRRMTVDQPRMVPHTINWRRQHEAVYGFDLELAHRKKVGILADTFQCHHTKRLGASGLLGETGITTRPRSIKTKSPAIVTQDSKVVLRAN